MQLGAFDSARDWGSAVDYAHVIPQTLELDTPQDFIFATGKETTVGEFLRLGAEVAGFSPEFEGEGQSMTCRDTKSGQVLAIVSPQYFRPFDTPPLIGNPTLLKQATSFAGSRDISTIAEEMVNTDIQRRANGMIHV